MVLRTLKQLREAQHGVAAVEFCLTLPILLLMTAGAYDVSRLIAARMDYQQALTEAAGLALARPPQAGDYIDIRKAAATAAGVPTTDVTVTSDYRCNNVSIVGSACPNVSDERALYVSITVKGSYTPMWTHFAINNTVPISITRTVRVQ